MRRYLLGLLLGLAAGGCAGKNTVAGRDKTNAEELESVLPTWCQTICQRIDSCAEDAKCTCAGDDCDCSGSGERACPSECQEEMRRYTVGGDACAAVGERFKSCIDSLTCAELNGGIHCAPSNAEEALCPKDDGSDTPPSSGGPDGGSTGPGEAPSAPSGAGGSSSSSHGTAGSATVGGGGPVGPAVKCDGAFGSGGSASEAPASTSVFCEEGRSGCRDGLSYYWVCVAGSQGQLGCSCFIDSLLVGSFDPGLARCPSLEAVNSGCRWNLVPN